MNINFFKFRLFSDADIELASSSKSDIFLFYGPRTNEPNEEVIKSSLKMAKIATKMKAGDLLLVCISGGGSALLTLPSPVDPTVSPFDFSTKRLNLEAIIKTSKLLSLEGATIQEVCLIFLFIFRVMPEHIFMQ